MAAHLSEESLLIDLQCFPSVNWYGASIKYNKLKFELYEHFFKGSCLNRYYVAGPAGRMLLTVPLLHERRERTPFRELKICNRDSWQTLHWRTLVSAYRRSAWFEYYEEELRVMYEKKFEYLMDWNLEAFHRVNRWLGVSWEISFTGHYQREADPGTRDLRNRFGRRQMEADAGGRPPYPQVFADRTGFLPGLSILDLVFTEGKGAVAWLRT
jgi:hypothetical protein